MEILLEKTPKVTDNLILLLITVLMFATSVNSSNETAMVIKSKMMYTSIKQLDLISTKVINHKIKDIEKSVEDNGNEVVSESYETSLGLAIVCDTGIFALYNPQQIDIAVNW